MPDCKGQMELFEGLVTGEEKSGYEMTPDEIRSMPNELFWLKRVRALEYLSDYDENFAQTEDALMAADIDGDEELRVKLQAACDEIVMKFLGVKYKWVEHDPVAEAEKVEQVNR